MNNGVEMPMLGVGTYMMGSGGEARRSVAWAIEAGYRLIDTATLYANERDVGEAVRSSGVPRDELFVTTKLWNSDQGYTKAHAAFEMSFRLLDIGSIDLYLVHWPDERLRRESWKALEEILADGRARAIGVSNYNIEHLEEMKSYAKVWPAVNQVEFSPFLFQGELLDYCQGNGIVLQAYSPLTRGARLRDPVLTRISSKHGKTAAQVMIRWALQHGVSPIPKSSHRGRLQENADVFDFELDEDDMRALDSLGYFVRMDWDPTGQP